MKNENVSANANMLLKINDLLGSEKELVVLKGKLITPSKHKTADEKGIYYSFHLRTLKRLSTDEYGTTFNTYHCIVPVEVSKRYSDDEISSFKDNEVICLLSVNCRIKKLQGDVVVNNATFFVNDIVLIRNVDNTINNEKVINL